MSKPAAALKELYELDPHTGVGAEWILTPILPPNTWKPTPNCSNRGSHAIDTIVIHCTAGGNTAGAVATLCDPKRGASAHIVIPDDKTPGEPDKTLRLVADEKKAWHCRKTVLFKGESDVNARSFGIEIVNRATEDDPYSDWQVKEAARWCAYWIEKFPIRYIVTHAYLDPARRADPCVTFPWAKFITELQSLIAVKPIEHENKPLVIEVNGTVIDADAEIHEGATWIELRPVAEALGFQVGFDAIARKVIITK
jgi:N-acetyl-anhydromuramyl-L-alanine amidase AmpD